MSTATESASQRKARIFRLYRRLPALTRDPLKELERLGRESNGEVSAIDLGLSRPYLITRPEHIQRVLRDNSANYVRDGVLWKPLHRLFGDGILSDGPGWEMSRKMLQPAFTARHIASLTDRMAEVINRAVDELGRAAAHGHPLQAVTEMNRIVNRTVIGIMFGDKISQDDMARVIPAIDTIAFSVVVRVLLPTVPGAVPLPGDKAYRNAIQTIDEVILPLVHRYRREPGDGDDLVTLCCQARTPDGGQATARLVRDNLVALLAAGTETTVIALTWLWPVLHANPVVMRRLTAEIDAVVGGEPVRRSHLPELHYTRQVVQELLRLLPVGWWFPRMVVRDDTLGGVRLKAGDNVVITPYLTHRLESVWERPLVFDPDRFAPELHAKRHRYAYFPFGGGPHQCVGKHLFNMEAQLIIAAILSRFRPVMATDEPITPRLAATLRPRQDVEVTFVPLRNA